MKRLLLLTVLALPLLFPTPALADQSSLQATLPTRDYLSLASEIQKHPSNPTHAWHNYLIISFSGIVDGDTKSLSTIAITKASIKQDIRFIIETLNRHTAEAPIIEITPNLWGVNIAKLQWDRDFVEEMAKKSPYYRDVPAKLKEFVLKGFDRIREDGPRDRNSSEVSSPIILASEFLKEAWEPEWYTKLLGLQINRDSFFRSEGIPTRYAQNIEYMGIVPQSEVQENPRKVAYLKTEIYTGNLRSKPAEKRFKPRDVFVTMNYENKRGTNDSLRYPRNVACQYNEIAVEQLNGLDIYYANAGGGDSDSDSLSNRLGNGDVKIGGLVKQIPTRAGTDHVHGGQILLGTSCITCHQAGAQSLSGKLVSESNIPQLFPVSASNAVRNTQFSIVPDPSSGPGANRNNGPSNEGSNPNRGLPSNPGNPGDPRPEPQPFNPPSTNDSVTIDARDSLSDRVARTVYNSEALAEKATKASARYTDAVYRINRRKPLENSESIKASIAFYQGPVSLKEASVRLGISERSLIKRLSDYNFSTGNNDPIATKLLAGAGNPADKQQAITAEEFENLLPVIHSSYRDVDVKTVNAMFSAN